MTTTKTKRRAAQKPEPRPTLDEQLLAAILGKNAPRKSVTLNADGHIVADRETDPELYDWAVNG